MSVRVDDQPIAARFFGEGRWLTEFITPTNLEVNEAAKGVTAGLSSLSDKVRACQEYVGSMKYVPFVKGTLTIAGKTSTQPDLWNDPSTTLRINVGNCANKSFLLTSMLRTFMSPSDVHCVLGNLYNGKVGGHAWVTANIGGRDLLLEATRDDVSPIPVEDAKRYEAVHLFNDKEVLMIPGKTVMIPMAACYSTWLKDYLNRDYINGGGH